MRICTPACPMFSVFGAWLSVSLDGGVNTHDVREFQEIHLQYGIFYV